MTPAAAAPRITADPARGGRWTSLHAAGREWLWHREEPRRAGVVPGDAFADAGGLEECVPTVRGRPDHGDAWTRPWRQEGEWWVADCPCFRFARRIRHLPDRAEADYRLSAAPGHRFVWAAHALLDLSPAARLDLPDAAPARLYADGGNAWTPFTWPDAPPAPAPRPGSTPPFSGPGTQAGSPSGGLLADPLLGRPGTLPGDAPSSGPAGPSRAPSGTLAGRSDAQVGGPTGGLFAGPLAGRTPPAGGSGTVPFDRLGPDDGTALGAIVRAAAVGVHDGGRILRFALEADAGQPVSVALWRNLGGFPEGAPYRSIGVEPMLGRVFDLAAAGPDEAARVPASGEVRWRLTVTAG
ncbi:hypothetical protein SAMN05216259_113111 [Actinacidiphila guanduensis]|uniref:Uncharacterized protein n=1 Tax=Actinacidiphila guanduensis TaxID=310781 RepID=A0A1H0MVG6_9ACTN|nr:hypothetical protein SAMN05216259_113111 [Actinacidiphila guanduensis]